MQHSESPSAKAHVLSRSQLLAQRAVGVEDFASGAAFGAATTGVVGFAANATGDGFGGAATVADDGALGVALSCCPSPARTIGAGMAAGAAFGAAGSGVEGCALGAVLSCCSSPPGTAIAGTAAAATVEVFGTVATGVEAEAGAAFGVGTAALVRAVQRRDRNERRFFTTP